MVPITRSQMALARGARTGGLDGPGALCGEDGVEGSGELGVAIADEEPDRVCFVGEVHREVAGLLGHPVSSRLGDHAGDPHEARVVVDEHQDVEPAEEDRVDMEEVAGHQSFRLCGEELRTGRPRPTRRGFDAVALEDRPDARGGDDDAHGGELAVDAPVAPSRVLLRQAEDKRGSSFRDGRSAGPAVWVRPVLSRKVPVPAQQGCWLDEEAAEASAGEQSCEPRQHRPICRLQRRSVDLAPEDCHLVSEHADLDGEVRVTATDESDELEDAAERRVEERKGHRWMLSEPESSRQSAGRRRWMAFSVPTPYARPGVDVRRQAVVVDARRH